MSTPRPVYNWGILGQITGGALGGIDHFRGGVVKTPWGYRVEKFANDGGSPGASLGVGDFAPGVDNALNPEKWETRFYREQADAKAAKLEAKADAQRTLENTLLLDESRRQTKALENSNTINTRQADTTDRQVTASIQGQQDNQALLLKQLEYGNQNQRDLLAARNSWEKMNHNLKSNQLATLTLGAKRQALTNIAVALLS